MGGRPSPELRRKGCNSGSLTSRLNRANPLSSRDFAALARLDRTTENRGVPGSSPGLAIGRNARWLLDLALSGALDGILKKGMKRGWPAETRAIPGNFWSVGRAVRSAPCGLLSARTEDTTIPRSRGVSGSSLRQRAAGGQSRRAASGRTVRAAGLGGMSASAQSPDAAVSPATRAIAPL